MGLTILTMIQKAEAELGLPQSTSIFGTNGANTDGTGIQMGALANRVLDELRRMNRWTALQFEFDLVVDIPISTTGDMIAESKVITNIPTTAGISANNYQVSGPGLLQAARVESVDSPSQVTMTMENVNTENLTGAALLFMRDTYPMPDGFDWFNNRTMWDRTNRWELIGPDSPQQDQWQRSGIIATGPRRHFRKVGPTQSSFRIWPPPADLTAPLQLVYEFLSINAVASKGTDAYTQYFADDTDQTLLDDNAIIMGIKWMFFEVKGFGSYVTLQQRWVDYVNRQMARDGAAGTLQINKRRTPFLLSGANVQDGYFPGPGGSGN